MRARCDPPFDNQGRKRWEDHVPHGVRGQLEVAHSDLWSHQAADSHPMNPTAAWKRDLGTLSAPMQAVGTEFAADPSLSPVGAKHLRPFRANSGKWGPLKMRQCLLRSSLTLGAHLSFTGFVVIPKEGHSPGWRPESGCKVVTWHWVWV